MLLKCSFAVKLTEIVRAVTTRQIGQLLLEMISPNIHSHNVAGRTKEQI